MHQHSVKVFSSRTTKPVSNTLVIEYIISLREFKFLRLNNPSFSQEEIKVKCEHRLNTLRTFSSPEQRGLFQPSLLQSIIKYKILKIVKINGNIPLFWDIIRKQQIFYCVLEEPFPTKIDLPRLVNRAPAAQVYDTAFGIFVRLIVEILSTTC